jgi:hypothetical protein
MSKRLQVILPDQDFRQIQRTARAQRLTVAEWVRRALAAAQRREPAGDAGRKLDAVRDAARLSYPTADIAQMLEEIERGYRTSDS